MFLANQFISSPVLFEPTRETDAPRVIDAQFPQSSYVDVNEATGADLSIPPSSAVPTGGTSAPSTSVVPPSLSIQPQATDATPAPAPATKAPCIPCTIAWLAIGAVVVYSILRARGAV